MTHGFIIVILIQVPRYKYAVNCLVTWPFLVIFFYDVQLVFYKLLFITVTEYDQMICILLNWRNIHFTKILDHIINVYWEFVLRGRSCKNWRAYLGSWDLWRKYEFNNVAMATFVIAVTCLLNASLLRILQRIIDQFIIVNVRLVHSLIELWLIMYYVISLQINHQMLTFFAFIYYLILLLWRFNGLKCRQLHFLLLIGFVQFYLVIIGVI